MKRLLNVLIWITCVSSTVFAQSDDTITNRIVLIGDAGALINGQHQVVHAIKSNIPLDKKTTVVFLGDNIYKVGLPDDAYIGYNQAKVVLDSQLSIFKGTPTKVYMIPGNHDWNNGGPSGYDAILREQLYVDLIDTTHNVKFYPEGGCPGPVEVPIGDNIVLVIIDSQWWIHPYDKPGIESDCPYKTKDEVLAQLTDIVTRNYKKLVILAMHHTLKSNGPHGGYYGVKQHIFPFTDMSPNLYIPLPIIGSIYPISRGVFGSPQDLRHPNYQNMITDIERVTKSHPNLIYAAGHEHSLQLIKDTGHYYVVSGTGYNSSRVSKGKNTLYASSEHGFAVLFISKNKNVDITFYTTHIDSSQKNYTKHLLDFSKLPELPKDTTKPIAEWKDTVLVAASNKYQKATRVQRWILGENYREEWSKPVGMKMFNINSEKGGFKILSLGGGKQTKSLKLEDKDGNEWSLRTIDKDPEKAIPENFRNSVAKDIVQDLISAANPYAPLTLPPLAKAANVIEASPELFFVPDDPSLGYYRPMFANTVCLLERKDPDPKLDTKSTGKVLQKMTEDNDHVVDQKALLSARLLDMLIADFDRHWDQWRWAEKDTGKGKLYIPVPKDRDQAYFYSDGLLMTYITRNRMPFLKGLHYNIPRINWLNYVARDFDRFFLNELDANDWNKIIVQFQNNVSDSVIWQGIRRYPPEIYPLSGEDIAGKLISRRNLLQKQGMRYYRFLSKTVNVVGSNKSEYFKVIGTDSGLHVMVYARKENGDTSFKFYDRNFVSHTTRELQLYGLNGNDVFDVDESAKSKIRLRIIGGKGNDTFNIRGRTKSFLYDQISEKNFVHKGPRTKNYLSSNAQVNEYNRTGFEYTQNRWPRLNVAYNQEDGFFFGAGFWRRTFGFRREPYATDQKITGLWAPARGAYQIKYAGEFNHITREYDLVVHSEIVDPVLNNFFGIGNETKILPDVPISFYYVRYRYLSTDVLIRKKFFNKLSVYLGPTFFHYWNNYNDNADKVLGYLTKNNVLDSAAVFSSKHYVGGKLAIDINNLNSELFPTRGIHWYNELTYQAGVSDYSHSVTRFQSDMTVYASMSMPAKTVAVLRLGGGHIFNRTYEFFQAETLGANNFLRGFRKNRFSGRSVAYGSLEVRQKLFTSKWYVVPGDFGLVLFNDLGRVWDPTDEPNHVWHYAYGGGIYYVPFNMVIVSATVGFSREEQLFNFSVGTKFNITF